MVTCALGLGSNLGDRGAMLDRAIVTIVRVVGSVDAVSSYYETAPWGETSVETFAYLNAAVRCRTRLSPKQLLHAVQSIELDAGRVRTVPNAPRPLDIDILFYGSEIIDTSALTLPHPRLHLRQFVLRPLVDIVPDYIHPSLQRTVRQLHECCTDSLRVTPLSREL